MKSCLKLVAIGLGLGLAGTTAHAMSELSSVSVTPLWPTNSNPGNTMLYEVQIERLGEGLLEVNLSSGCLPAGCHVSFDTNPVRFTGREPQYQMTTMAVSTDRPISADACGFTVTATAQRETITCTNHPCATPNMGFSAPVLIQIIPCVNGDMEIHGVGGSCACQRIESTTNLANPNWASVGSCTADGNGRFTFIHNQAQTGGCTQRFYRAVSVASEN